ncbi:pectate lyase-like [Wolffia australiana]
MREMGRKRGMGIVMALVVIVLVGAASAHIVDFDDSWRAREEAARAAALAAYHPDPEAVADNLNDKVQKTLEGTKNGTRRQLRKYTGPCLATNPIDRCWRCRGDWARNRKQLARCALGFGRNAMGGKNGRFYVVTDPSDSDLVNPRPGTLRHAAIQTEPLWIIFARDMIIRLSEELLVASYKTIDARGANVHIAYGAGITLQFVQHVIIHGLHIHDIKAGSGGMIRDSLFHYGLRARSDGDGISIFGASNIWVDHVSMSNCMDGLIDVVQGSTAITISNNHFTHHDHVMLFGASDTYALDAIMQITVAFNHFGRGLVQRMPRCRWGFFHVLNNDYTHWIMYAIGGSKKSTIISQGNRYIAPPDVRAKEVTHRVDVWDPEWKTWKWRSEGDLMLNGAFFIQSGKPGRPSYSSKDMIKAKPGSFVTRLTRFAGSLTCKVNWPC